MTDKNITNDLNKEELEILEKILSDLQNGDTQSFDELWQEDFEEIPVSIDEFLEKDEYLGVATNNGKSIYPFWRKELHKIFEPDSKITECIFSGSIGIGKSTIAIVGMAYILYNVLCLKSPQRYYGLQEGDAIVFSFFNATLRMSETTGYLKFNTYLLSSTWFLKHGTKSGTKNEIYVPGKNIHLQVGSKLSHSLGQNILCIGGDTLVNTIDGDIAISNLENKLTRVIDKDGNVSSNTISLKTKDSTEYLQIILEDGTILKCSEDHKFLLKNGEYKKAKDLTTIDILFDVE